MRVDSETSESFEVHYSPVTNQMKRTWNDPEEATEKGACGVAILLIRKLTNLTVVLRSRKRTGFDYWMGTDDGEDTLIFENKSRLEISGIRNGTPSQIRQRVNEKLTQTNPSDSLQIPAYVVVVEFSRPITKVVRK